MLFTTALLKIAGIKNYLQTYWGKERGDGWGGVVQHKHLVTSNVFLSIPTQKFPSFSFDNNIQGHVSLNMWEHTLNMVKLSKVEF